VRPRTLARAAVAAAALITLSGCAGWGISGGGAKGTVTLTYALWDPHEQIGYQASIDQFEKIHPNIKVNIENVPYGSYEQKITAEFITGGAPDLFWVNTPWLGTFVKDGILTNIAPQIKANHIDMSQYYPQLVALHSRNGAIYGLPKDWDTIAYYYNINYFKQHHIVNPRAPPDVAEVPAAKRRKPSCQEPSCTERESSGPRRGGLPSSADAPRSWSRPRRARRADRAAPARST